MLTSTDKLAILFAGHLDDTHGKMGHGVLRYSPHEIVCCIDHLHGGARSDDVLGYGPPSPIVADVDAAHELGATVLVIGITPSGGRLPDTMVAMVDRAVALGMSVVNGLHNRLQARYSDLTAGQWIWDIRQEPADLRVGDGQARLLPNKRVLMVGTDMAIGKMTVGLECHHEMQRQQINSAFVPTGQIGITIMGRGVPLDAIRLDYASGAIQQQVMDVADADVIFIEGQGSLLHPGSSATLPLLRGSMPTHLVLCHKAGKQTLKSDDSLAVPDLAAFIKLYESLTAVCGTFPSATTVAVAVNTHGLDEADAQAEIAALSAATGLVCTDVVRFSAAPIVEAILAH